MREPTCTGTLDSHRALPTHCVPVNGGLSHDDGNRLHAASLRDPPDIIRAQMSSDVLDVRTWRQAFLDTMLHRWHVAVAAGTAPPPPPPV